VRAFNAKFGEFSQLALAVWFFHHWWKNITYFSGIQELINTALAKLKFSNGAISESVVSKCARTVFQTAKEARHFKPAPSSCPRLHLFTPRARSS
jgi:hypothetical protein